MKVDWYCKTAQATGDDFNETLRTVIMRTGNFECDESEIEHARSQAFHDRTQPGVGKTFYLCGWMKDTGRTEPALLVLDSLPQQFDVRGFPDAYYINAIEVYWDYDEVDAYWELDKLHKRCYQDTLNFHDDVYNIQWLYDGLTVDNVRFTTYHEDRITRWFYVPEFDIVEEE